MLQVDAQAIFIKKKREGKWEKGERKTSDNDIEKATMKMQKKTVSKQEQKMKRKKNKRIIYD